MTKPKLIEAHTAFLQGKMPPSELRELEDAAITDAIAMQERVGLKRRVEAASRYVDLDRLCLSPQCGFASGYTTDRLSLDDEERKLAHMVNIAAEIWG